ncbi:MAG: lysophospholipid acyltransferase family protein [Phycisphaerales bacterium]
MPWPDWSGWVIAAIAAWVAFALLVAFIMRTNPRGTVLAGLIWWAVRLYTHLWHRLRVDGRESVPPTIHPGPLIVVMNHTAGIDPLLVQSVVPFEIRWMMSADMRFPPLEWLWRYLRIIFVDRSNPKAAGPRDAIRHVTDGGILGIFPEGGLERPARHILPFAPGIGFLIQRTGAPILPVIIDGTPIANTAWESLTRRSRSRLTFKPLIDYSASGLGHADIAADLRRRYLEWTGWTAADRWQPPAAPAEEPTERSAAS